MTTNESDRTPKVRARLLAVIFDTGMLVLLLSLGLLVAFTYLLIRTSWGRFDVASSDALVAASLIGAIVPTWAMWLIAHLHLKGATPGQALLGLSVEGQQWRRLARLLVHPISIPLWIWGLLTAFIAQLNVLLVPIALVLLMVTIPGLISFGMLLIRGDTRLLHDYLFSTRMVITHEQA